LLASFEGLGLDSDAPPFQADPPNWQSIPQDDVLGVTVILLTCAYAGQEFIRVGYYVNNEYADEALRDCPPPMVQIDKVVRSILADKPRVTRYNIDYGVAPVGTPSVSDLGAPMEAVGFGGVQASEYSPDSMYAQQSGFGGDAMMAGGAPSAMMSY
jgi:hypothetical protein